MISFPIDPLSADPDKLRPLSDESLWTIVREQLPERNQAWLHLLLERRAHGTLSAEDHRTLAALLEQDQQLMRRKAEAAMLLIERGYYMP